MTLKSFSISRSHSWFSSGSPGLYVITCLPLQKYYIGESEVVSRRLTAHKSQLRRGVHENRTLQNDFLQYGEANFKFVPLLFGRGSAKDMRQTFETCILCTLPASHRYNVYTNWRSRGPETNPFFGHQHTKETRAVLREAFLGRPSAFAGRTQSEAVREKIREENRGKSDRRKPLSIAGIVYESISQASQETGLARRLLRERCESSAPRFAHYQYIEKQEEEKAS